MNHYTASICFKSYVGKSVSNCFYIGSRLFPICRSNLLFHAPKREQKQGLYLISFDGWYFYRGYRNWWICMGHELLKVGKIGK